MGVVSLQTMPIDVFISYSRSDSEQALSLADRLRRLGAQVWIDQHGIEASKVWSEEIVNAIEASKAVVVLLSSKSVASDNVARELALAFESGRRLLPVALEDVALPSKFKYPLAGIQRVAFTEHDAITQALIGCGVGLKVAKDERKTLLVMPFEDFSPTRDNVWFADGLAGELTDMLSHLKALKLIDRKTSQALRGSSLSVFEIATTLEAAYVIEGSVRKFGDQIKISTSLLDVANGEYLWQESHKGVMDQVFELQEAVAERVVEALHLHLTASERTAVEQQQTRNAEAYEFFLRGSELYRRQSHETLRMAVDLYKEAIRLDPSYAQAWGELAGAHFELYRLYEHVDRHLNDGMDALDHLRQLQGESAFWCWMRSRYHLLTEELDEAEKYARAAVATDPEYAQAYHALGSVLWRRNVVDEAAQAWRECAHRNPNPISYFNYLLALDEPSELAAVATEAREVYERHLRLHPDDYEALSKFVLVLLFTGDRADAQQHAEQLLESNQLSGFALFNLGWTFDELGDRERALAALRKSIDRGFSDISGFYEAESALKDTPEFQAIVQELEAKLASGQTAT